MAAINALPASEEAARPRRPRPLLRRVALWLGGSVIALIALLAVLGVLTGTLGSGRPQGILDQAHLPYYADASLRPRWDTWAGWHRTASFALTSQHGAAVDEQALQGRPAVVGFFYSACATQCPVSSQLLRLLDQRLKAEGPAASPRPPVLPRFVLLSLTPDLDRPQDLDGYALRLELPSEWTLLTGQQSEMDRLAASLMTDTSARRPDGEPLHGERVFLLDGARRIRGIYTADSTMEMRRLANDYWRLLSEDKSPA